MGGFTSEFIDVSEGPEALAPRLGIGGFAAQQTNANRLADLLRSLIGSTTRTVVYFPPGRYLIGRPTTPMGGVHNADIVVPWNVTLKFASGAQLVPMGYFRPQVAPEEPPPTWLPRPLDGLQVSESFKVRIEIEGCIEAGIYPIFDSLVNEGLDPDTDTIQEAGRILLRGNAINAVYPEWWNAVPLVNEQVPSPSRVRRTTVALQMAIDAAHNRRVPTFGLRIGELNGRLPSIPIVLVNDYAIDSPLRIGATMAQSRGVDVPANDAPYNPNGLVVQGGCGPATRRFGAALIKAADNFAPSRAPSDLNAESSSMLTIRGEAGVTVQNVVFDANERVERCVTLSLRGGGAASQNNGFEGCEFRNARRELVHIGGESVLPQRDGVAKVTNLAMAGNQDLSGLRFTRCRFETGSPERVDATAREISGKALARDELPITEPLNAPILTGYWRVGVMFRARESLPVELHGCVFVGPASPMILGLGGRLSLQNCAFRTDKVPRTDNGPAVTTDTSTWDSPLRQWNGTDILCALALAERTTPGAEPQPVGATSITARNIESRSRQFLSTFKEPLAANGAIYSSITLIHVRHLSDFSTEAEDRERPAIYWGGPRLDNNNTALVLMGCVFGDARSPRTYSGGVYVANGDLAAPVVDLGARRLGGTEVFDPAVVRNVLRLGATADRTARR